jgi:HTH-type transcriptional regulator/antitoxin HigA
MKEMQNRTIAEAFPPGEFLKEELDARGWTQEDLANILGRQTSVVSAIVNGKRAISLDIATDLGEAFDTGLEYWMNLETIYRSFLKSKRDSSIARRAKLFAKAPVSAMQKRNWIEASGDWEVLEQRVLRLLRINSLDEQPKVFPHAAKKASSYESITPEQTAWFFRARDLASGIQVAKFSENSFAETIRSLRQLLANVEDIRHVPRVLAEGGVRFLIIENISHSKIDGACFWLDASSPVIAMAIRYDRLDNFWYVLTHECGHVDHRDGLNDEHPIIDVNLVGDEATPFADKSEIEQRADLFAQNTLIDQGALDNWIARVAPLYSKMKITAFAKMNRVHPAIVLGQLQHRGEVHWSHSREMLVKMRHLVMSSALTDGFGHVLPASA